MPRQYIERYRAELLERIMPFWMTHSPDPEYGGFFTCLDRSGAVYDPRKYVWMNGRQVWTLCKLYNEVEPRDAWLDAARPAAEFLRQHVFDRQGRCWFRLTKEGRPAGYQRKPYAAVFTMLGFLEYSKATGDHSYRQLAESMFARIQDWIRDPSLLGRPEVAGGPPMSQLADLYVNLFMGLELGGETGANAIAGALKGLEAHFETSQNLLLESAVLDPACRFDYPEGRLICAGSIFEVSWLVLQALRAAPDEAMKQRILETLDCALHFSWDREHDGFFYFQDLQGKPGLPLEWSQKLWWVHVEAICAVAHAYAETGEPKWMRWLEVADDYIFRHFPDPQYGEWFGYLEREGKPSQTLKGGAYKGCFHIPRALWLSARELERSLSPQR